MSSLKRVLRAVTPRAVLEWRRDALRRRDAAANAGRSNQEIFEGIYAGGKWGGEGLEDGSGTGSAAAVGRPYVDLVNRMLRENGQIRRIVDIGCGDFRIAAQFELTEAHSYLGLDVVRPLIERNRATHGSDRVAFDCLDAVTDPLPPADLYLVRQVLQHLSNDSVAAVLAKLADAPFALITEHHPAPERLTQPNLDKPTGADVRVYDGSGVFLDRPPFALSSVSVALTADPGEPLVAPGETLVTYLLTGRAPAGA